MCVAKVTGTGCVADAALISVDSGDNTAFVVGIVNGHAASIVLRFAIHIRGLQSIAMASSSLVACNNIILIRRIRGIAIELGGHCGGH